MSKISVEKENIFLNLETVTKEEAIRMSGNKLLEAGYVANGYVESMLYRENILSTYMGSGVALPHGDRESEQLIIESGIVFLQFKEGIDFGDGNLAEIVIASSGKGNNHLKILASLATLLKKDDILDTFTTSNNVDEIYNLLKNSIK